MSLTIDAKIQKWGNGLGLRVSGAMRDIPHFFVDTPVSVEIFEEGFTVKKSHPKTSPLPFSEATLLAGLTENTAQADLLAAPLDDEWPE